jgi:hypothetical protein
MHPTWLVEADVFKVESEALLAALRRHGFPVQVVRPAALHRLAELGGLALDEPACVLFHGTWPVLRHLQLHSRWTPAGWHHLANLDCVGYYPHFGRFLLNQRYAMLPGVEAVRQQDWLFALFGRDDEVFVRPTGSTKLFTGRCIPRDDFATALAPARYDPATLVVIAAPRVLQCEWRLVVAGDEVLAGCQYALGGEARFATDCPDSVAQFAQAMLAAVPWRPDPIFMMDLGESDGQLYLLELNSFSCSGLYVCELDRVVAVAGELARREWENAERTSAKPRG